MIIRKSLLGLAAAGMVFGSTAATAAPVSMDRAGSDVAGDELAGVGTFGLLLARSRNRQAAHDPIADVGASSPRYVRLATDGLDLEQQVQADC